MDQLTIERKDARQLALQSFIAADTMVSNTGCTSLGEMADHPQDLADRGVLRQCLCEALVELAGLLEPSTFRDFLVTVELGFYFGLCRSFAPSHPPPFTCPSQALRQHSDRP